MSGEHLEQLRLLAEQMRTDIELCRTREDHVRQTARANEAARLYAELFEIQTQKQEPQNA